MLRGYYVAVWRGGAGTATTLGDGSRWVYSYDTRGQLVSASRQGADQATWPGLQYDWAYDAIGNRTTAWEEGQTP